MRVEYKNPEILKRPDTRIVLKDVQGIWEADTKTLRLYYEGIIQNMPTTIVSTDGDEILELFLEEEASELGNCGNIIYIEFPLDTRADISLPNTSNITYLESRGYAIGDNILRGINASSKARLEKFISKASWYRYFRINRLAGPTNLKRLDWAGRSISKDYYERHYSDLHLFCDGMDENSLVVYDFKMSTSCITFYGFATEETWKVEGNDRRLVARELVSLENIPGLVISDLPGATQNFVISIDSEHLRAELLTIPEFNQEETETIYQAEFIAEIYDSLGQRTTSIPIEITTMSELLDWNWDRERSTTMFVEGNSPVFLFRHNDYDRGGVFHTLRVKTIKPIDNIDDVSIEPIDDPYFTYDKKLDTNDLGGNDIVVHIYPAYTNPTNSWIPRLYADVPEPRTVKYKNHKLDFYPIIGPRNTDLYVIEPGDSEENEIDALELPNNVLGGNYIVKTNGDDTYWGGFATNTKVYATKWGYTGYVAPEVKEEDIPVTVDEGNDNNDNTEPKVELTNFDIPGIDTSGAQTSGLWIFPCSCSVRPGQIFTIETGEVKGSNKIWCNPDHLGPAVFVTAAESHNAATSGGSSRSSTSRGSTSSGSSSGGSGTVTRQGSNVPTTNDHPVLSDSSLVYDCFYLTRCQAPDTPGTYDLKVYGKKDQSKVGYCRIKVMGTADTSGDPLYIKGSTNMVVFKKSSDNFPSGTDVFQRGYYKTDSFTLGVYTYRKSNVNTPTLVKNLGAADCDITYRITRSGIIDHIENTSSGLKIYCGNTYGVTQLIIYLKSDPSIFIDIPVVLFGGKYTNYQLAN